jgi:hypothetical protein
MIMPASMTSAAPAVDPVEVFELRAWARAVLFFIGEIDLQQAVDMRNTGECGSGTKYLPPQRPAVPKADAVR